MKKISLIRYETKPEFSEENRRLVERSYAELDTKDPGGIRYTTIRLPDDATFIHIFISETADEVLGELSAFREFAESASLRMAARSDVRHGAVIGSYRFPGA